MTYSLKLTDDGSFTAFNNDYQEDYHSRAGAYYEAQKKYFELCQLPNRIDKDKSIVIIEIGFGLGINLIPVLHYLKQSNNAQINYISLENDPQILDFNFKEADKLYPKEYGETMKLLNRNKFLELNGLTAKIILGDALTNLRELKNESVDVIYHDAFSPKKNPECWSIKFFKEEYRILKKEGILSTYSMATKVRAALLFNHFYLYEGVSDHRKKGGTVASKIQSSSYTKLTDAMLQKATNSMANL